MKQKDIWQKFLEGVPRLNLVEVSCPGCGSKRYKTVAQGVDFEYLTCSNVFSFVRCCDCSIVFLNPRPAFEDFKVIYPPDYYSFPSAKGKGRYSKLVQKAWDIVERRRIALFRKLLGEEEKKILDLGCGYGRLLKILRKYGYQGWSLTGIEFGLSDDFGKYNIEGAKIYKGYFEEVEFPEAPFDLIIAQQVIEHAYNPSLMLKKVYRDLVAGGYAIFDTPNFDGIDRKLFSSGYWGGYHFPRHMALFTSETFCTFARSFGFEVVSSTKMLSPAFWALSLHNFLLGHGFPQKWAKKIHYQTLPLVCISTLIEIFNLLLLKSNSNMRIILKKPLL